MTQPLLHWNEEGAARTLRWRSESSTTPPKRVQPADDRTTADAALRLASEGTALLWRGDFQNARQLLQALARRIDRKPRKPAAAPATPAEAFYRYRQTQGRRARVLGMLLIEVDGAYRSSL